ncbi:Serine hydroxymethyltransferase [Streptomyces sp. MBT84]|nr:Serine hydroxymethyltransferase [Streptomyces sp. MBT84]
MILDTCALPHGDARGLRLGTAALTTQGMGEAEMSYIAALLVSVLRDEVDGRKAREEVRELAGGFPPYPGW